jgi:23S rRNA (pseudouridine1915-N3)-methyltransferase
MKIFLWSIGGRHEDYVKAGIEDFTARVNRYYSCEWKLLAPPKNAASFSETLLRDAESRMLLEALDPVDYVVLLDERGKMISSPELARKIEERTVNGAKRMHFVIGGAFGVNEEVRRRADLVWSLSKLVFPHQLVRLILAEQVYRACSIIRGEKYHHQ